MFSPPASASSVPCSAALLSAWRTRADVLPAGVYLADVGPAHPRAPNSLVFRPPTL